MALLRVVVGIPTVGRADVLSRTVAELTSQTRPPDQVIVCGTEMADVVGVAQALPDICLLFSPGSLTRQRNAIIAAADDADIVVFFDDDFLPHSRYLAAVEAHMVKSPSTALVTGLVIADGIKGAGLSVAEGLEILRRFPDGRMRAHPVFSAYGCNMGIRLAPLRQHGLQFDERLPLYGWQEDVDFSRRLAVHGAIMQLEDAQGVHLGTKLGRGSGLRLGYSQVVNPLYLAAKRLGYPAGYALQHIGRNVAMNLARSFRPEPYIDRRGRLLGNALALRDLLGGRLLPERVLELRIPGKS